MSFRKGLIALALSIAPMSAPASAQTAAPTIVGVWQGDGSGYRFVVRRMGTQFDVEWVGQGLTYTLLEAGAEDFQIQLDQGLQQTFVRCGLTNSGQSLLCSSRFVQNGSNAGMSDPFTYQRVGG